MPDIDPVILQRQKDCKKHLRTQQYPAWIQGVCAFCGQVRKDYVEPPETLAELVARGAWKAP